ncbi:RecQ family ATP-dependent DNA helicase [Marinobacterium weihaiense]|uniref:DNA 3'-5' helicase n=1 Tax=Marinobacterium weihaiense TaxID=2851016 RepID=A0ABS6MD05_9GAMM|nr:RecQ family ATP-dependent DNA helicase [Marinobacterium weihaiense]MBV0934182.1 RecQ family ATP-dependent DNA helicase [Marinobacterium weihaiense]
MIKVIILDLDDTLLDTKALEPLRQAGQWREVRYYLRECSVHENVLGILNTARSSGVKIAIFTNGPSSYVKTLLAHFDISVDYIVAYHDVQAHKPASEGVQKILDYFSVSADEALYLGDSELDQGSAQSAGVEFFAVEWGTVKNIDSGHFGVANLSEAIGSRLSKESGGAPRSELLVDGNKLYLGYYIEGIKQEVWSFKDGVLAAINRWTNKVVELSDSFPDINFVVRALGHAELGAEEIGKPLDKLGDALADALQAEYQPTALKKSKILKKSTGISAAERAAQVEMAYSFTAHENVLSLDRPRFLIVDDVYTSGATTREIQRAITEECPSAQVFIFTLVKTLYRSEANKASLEMQHNNHLFSDLYNRLNSEDDGHGDALQKQKRISKKLVSKKVSANYTNTNHNFVFHNLPLYSIASEAKSEQLYGALQILKNILQRGKPTVASRRLRSAFGLDFDESGLDFDVLPLISSKPVSWQRLIRGDQKRGNYPARIFFEELMEKHLGEYGFLKQLTVPEVQIFDMTQVYVDQFQNRQVDFFIPHIGAIIEIDGFQHTSSAHLDQLRDDFTETLGLRTFRFTTTEISAENEDFLKKMGALRNHIARIDALEQEGILSPPNGLTLQKYAEQLEADEAFNLDPRLQLTAACRFQLLLLELVERGVIRLGELTKLTLINHDEIDFVWDALEDLNELLANLFCLQGVDPGLLNLEIEELTELSTDRDGSTVVVDFSLFERFDDQHQVNQDVIFVRTDYFDFYRHFPSGDASSIENYVLEDYDYFRLSCAKPIEYALDLSPASAQRESLRYFLSNIFLPTIDQVDFREGQVGIIGSALSRHSTIGLLPTGSGKSICYQLSAMLQPAVSFVVCPIKSLMYDQKADLDAIGFSRSNYITSDLKPEDKVRVQRDFGRGKYFYVFISPERFQTHTFRREMSAIGLDLAFAYAVIDEVHCLSEWGHDFRISYLNLANTIEKFAPSASYIGLTATASVYVLKDIQTEFNILDEYIRTPLNFTRDELSFHIIDDKGRKNDAIVELVSQMEKKWNSGENERQKAGIIFTPTVNGNKGCHSLAGRLSTILDMDVRYFSGSPPKMGRLQGDAFDRYKRQVQDDFKGNKYHLLTATKAFGMGVNKGNIAYTIHYGIPGSMEALYQEAGRAGRDKHLFQAVPADCYVLLTKEPNNHILEKIWDQATNVTDLKDHVKKLSRESDLNTNMFLMTANLDTINDEFKLISNIYNYLKKFQEHKTITINARQFRVEKSKLEKAIYRLFQLGIVSDWVIENFFDGVIQVEFQCPDIEILKINLENTIRKYEAEFNYRKICSSDNKYYMFICNKREKGEIDESQFIFLFLLLWSYDHFVYNRRQSQKNVYEQCIEVLGKDAAAEADFKANLEGYFRHDKSSQRLLHLAENSTDTSLWLSVFRKESPDDENYELISTSELMILSAQISRFLESYKDNPCLDYLSGVTRLTSDQFDDTDGEIRMSSAFDKLLASNKGSALTLVRETLDLKDFFSEESRSRFARLVHKKFNDLTLLEEVNAKFRDSYSYHILLSPLASRLERLTSSYKGIDW